MQPGQSSSHGFASDLDPGMQSTPPRQELKLGSLVALFCVTLLFGWVPLCIFRGTGRFNLDPETRQRMLGLLGSFASGVFLATCLLDQEPDYLAGISEAFGGLGVTLQFPLPEFIMAVGFLLVLVTEQIVLALQDQTAVSLPHERQVLLAAPDVDSRRAVRRSDRKWGNLLLGGAAEAPHLHVDPSRHAALRAFFLVLSLSLHSALGGLAAGGRGNGRRALELGPPLLLHKGTVAFSLALALLRGRLRRAVAAGGLLLFSLAWPLGAALAETRASPRLQVMWATLEGLTTGTFLYVTLVEIAPLELSSAQGRVHRVALLLAGFAVVSGALFGKV